MAKTDRPKVLLDTCAFLAWIKGEEEQPAVELLMDFIDGGHAQMAESVIILSEVFKRPAAGENWGPRLDDVLNKLRGPDVILYDVTRPVAELTARYRHEYNMHTPDATHLATAVLNRCDWLVTKDDGFPDHVESLQIFHLNRMEPEDRFPWAPDRPVDQLVSPLQDELFELPDNVRQMRPGQARRQD